MNDLYLRSFSINWSNHLEPYVHGIRAIRSLREFSFSKRITLFTGENGSGKSTLLEALAVASGLNPEGGTQNYRFHTYDDHSSLSNALRLRHGAYRPKWSYFLRAESFYNMATAANTDYYDPGRPPLPDYHARSHGESFLDFITDHSTEGLYFMDELEAALSPQRQLELLIFLHRMAKKGSQFIIVTHSPILLGLPDADIVSFDNGELRHVSYEETQSYQIIKMFVDHRERMLQQLLAEDE